MRLCVRGKGQSALLTKEPIQYGAVETDSIATLSETSAINEQDTKSLLVNAS